MKLSQITNQSIPPYHIKFSTVSVIDFWPNSWKMLRGSGQHHSLLLLSATGMSAGAEAWREEAEGWLVRGGCVSQRCCNKCILENSEGRNKDWLQWSSYGKTQGVPTCSRLEGNSQHNGSELAELSTLLHMYLSHERVTVPSYKNYIIISNCKYYRRISFQEPISKPDTIKLKTANNFFNFFLKWKCLSVHAPSMSHIS